MTDESTHNGTTFADLPARVGHLFKTHHYDTFDIARVLGQDESIIYRALAEWRDRTKST